MKAKTIYKICGSDEWDAARKNKRFTGAEIDLQDGYIHFSTAETVKETAGLHFTDRENLVLVAVDVEKLGDALKWEASRGGDLFPHLFADLTFDAVKSQSPLPLGKDGLHQFPRLEE